MLTIIGVCALAVVLSLALSSCSFMSKSDKHQTANKSDSVAVTKEKEALNKVDTSKSKSESAYTKETFFFPGRDTTINNYIFQPSQPAVYIRESGTQKEEKQNFNFESWLKEKEDSIRIAQLQTELNKKKESEGSVLSVGQLIGIALIGLVLIGIVLMAFHFKSQITSIKNLITKN
jgi:hypothetical protein